MYAPEVLEHTLIAIEHVIIIFSPRWLVVFSRLVPNASHMINWWTRFQKNILARNDTLIGGLPARPPSKVASE